MSLISDLGVVRSFRVLVEFVPVPTFIRTLGSGQGHMDGVWFQVVDQRAQFVFDGTATAAAAGPAAVAEVVVTLHSPSSPDNIWRVYVQGPDSTAGPIVWHEEGQLPPGFYAISIHVRTSGVADFRTVNTVNTASGSFSCAFTFTQ